MPREKIVRGRDLRVVSASVPTTRDNSSEREINEIQSTITDIKQVFQELKDAGYELQDEANEKTIDIKTGKSKKPINRHNTRLAAAREAAKKRIENTIMRTVGTVGRPIPQVIISNRAEKRGEEESGPTCPGT